MANVQVIQRNAHLAGPVRLDTVSGREGPVSKAVFTAISNSRRGSGEGREEESTAIQWTLWGKPAENAAQYLGKGSHVNIVGRMRNNNFERNGETVYSMTFTAEEVDYLDKRADGQALRSRQDGAGQEGGAAPSVAAMTAGGARTPGRGRKAAGTHTPAEEEDSIPF
jgi:single stranded DNA-binding protein